MGVHLSYGTDCPVEDCNPFPNIYIAVTRKDRQGRPAGGFYPLSLIHICVNIGGAGTLVASLASLITFREYTKHVKGQTGRFMVLFLSLIHILR